jgi:predicted nucleic acid-binding protein
MADHIQRDDADLHAPSLCDVEVVSALLRILRSGEITWDQAEAGVRDYLDLPLTRHGHQDLLPRIMELRQNFSAYDATYVALAERTGGRLLTGDVRLAAAARSHSSAEVLLPPTP